ncbi:MAG: hypothetical protein HOC91_04325 [Nitrospinaceae bacterium]|jgi:hypothetical protein|nr:hypothetical protein [Nitrospinaceae bacterium]MBT3434378.1 hypothetical protein [Nitrospinaceae bacterium]MBT3821330.1 hypothetical protein [Nitrospinaceae bacterium]MBT4093665.1 hypothetical protein [Nitrospinaceae bacterium]MBT4429720.1 hypothetical protein [Nitrospinaceae bacterium]
MKSGNIADVKYCHDEDEAPRLDEDTDIYLSEGESFQDLNTFDFTPDDIKAIRNHHEEAISLLEVHPSHKSSKT